jgi:myo-inositol 2-dehydrogenase / D-chiro-inositol 1-dehydrogenase
MERFETAYRAQIHDFVDKVLQGGQPTISGADAIAALRISLAATTSLKTGRPVEIRDVDMADEGSGAAGGQ